MNVTNSARSAGERREVVVEVLAQAVLDLILRGGADVRRRPPRRPRREADAQARVLAEAVDAG